MQLFEHSILSCTRTIVRRAKRAVRKIRCVSEKIIKILGKTVPFVVYQTSTKWLGAFAGPLGLILTASWTIIDVAGPAYRVTIPATIYIASLRQAKLFEVTHNKCPKCETLNEQGAKFCQECGASIS